jgi:glycosyltransferase involved in cell wall biosynthesis
MNAEPEVGEALRVALLTADAGLGGAEKQMFYMARELHSAGVSVRVYNLRGGGYYEEALRERGIPAEAIRRVPFPPARLWFVARSMGPFRPHIIQAIHGYANFYAAFAAKRLGALAVGGLREAAGAHMARYGVFAPLLLRLPDAVAVNSRCAASELKERRVVDGDRLAYLPNAIDLAGIRAGGGEADGSCTCIAAGRLIPLKRLDVFLRALEIARRREPGIRGLVAGGGPELPRLERLAGELGLLPAHVIFAGCVENAADLFAASSVCVLCAESEGTPNVLLEAMAAALPVVTTPAGDAPDLVRRAGAGFVVRPDPDAIANRMVELARSSRLRCDLGRAGRNYVVQHHSAANLAPWLLAMYDDIARLACEKGRAKRMRPVAAVCAAARGRCLV